MKIYVNDNIREVSAPLTVRDLLNSEYDSLVGIAVAVNDRLVRRSDWESFALSDNDSVVIIKAAYGG